MTACVISCELHDYIEIACLYGYQVKLLLKDHRCVEGRALDTLSTEDKCEYLLIDNGETQRIALHELKSLQVLTANAQFSEVCF